MVDCASRRRVKDLPPFSVGRVLTVLTMGAALAAAPMGLRISGVGLDAGVASALAKGGNDGDHGGGNDGDHGNGGDKGNDGDHGNGGDKGNAGDRGNRGGNGHGADKDKGGNGNNATAKSKHDGGVPPGHAKRDEDHGNAQYTFTNAETQSLIANGWAGPKSGGNEKNHGQYVSLMVHTAKNLGYSARDGALQANFLPDDWYATQAELREAEAILADPDSTEAEKTQAEQDIIDLKAELDLMAADIEDWKPGNGPQGDEWATVNLDWNGDGYVDEADVQAKEGGDPEAELYLPDGV